jgi:hypothetical protein
VRLCFENFCLIILEEDKTRLWFVSLLNQSLIDRQMQWDRKEEFCWLIGIVKSEKTMKKFADSAVKYLRKHKFDGLDLGKLINAYE